MGFLVSSPLSGQEAKVVSTYVPPRWWGNHHVLSFIPMYMYISCLYGFRTSSPLSGPETIGGFRIFTTQVVRKPPGCLSDYPHMYGYTPFLYGFRISSPLSGPETVSGFRLFTTQVVGKPLRRFILSGYTPFLYGFRISSPLSGPETVSGFRLFTTQVVGKPLRLHIIWLHTISIRFLHFVTAKWSGNRQCFPPLYHPGGRETTTSFHIIHTCIIHIIPLGFPHFVTTKWSGNHQWFPNLYRPGGWETNMSVSYYSYIKVYSHFLSVMLLCILFILITLLVIYFILCCSYV